MKTATSLWDEIKAETAAELLSEQLCSDGENGVDCWLITGEVLGKGEENLGKELMRDLIAALAAGEIPPCYLIFTNSGVRLLAENGAVMPLVYSLARRGTSVLVSKKSAEYYGIAVDPLFAADTGAMVQALKSAAKVITL